MRRSLLALFVLLPSTRAAAQVEAFDFVPGRVPVGTVSFYTKRAYDGTHRSQVAIYVAAADRIESFKYGDGTGDGTLVTATLDWPRFSIRRLESWRLTDTTERRLQGWLESDSTDPGAVRLSFAPDQRVPVAHWPWHSYDFDWASLGLTLPHLRHPERAFTIHRTDLIYGENDMSFGEVGAVTFTPLRTERRHGRATRVYQMRGPGIADSTGTLWVDRALGYITEYRIPLGDEPGIRTVHLTLDRRARMTPAEWQEFQHRTLTPPAGH